MSSGPADRNIDWLPLSCPSCKVNLHIKMAYAHMQGRCPECGRRIEAPRPSFHPPTVGELGGVSPPVLGQELPDLVPIEEEWPEPARVDGAGESAVYSLADSPTSPTEPKHQTPAEEVFELADLAEPFSPANVRPLAPAGAGLHTTAQPRQQHDHELDPLLIREPAPPPPDLPFVEGIYTFPWSGSNPRVWFILVLEVGVLVTLVSILRGLLYDGHPVIRAVLLPILGVAIPIVFFTFGSYVAHCFLRILEETAAGNRECEWECTGIVDRTGKFFYLLWLCALCTAVISPVWGTCLAISAPEAVTWTLATAAWVILFPVVLLSSLTASSQWLPLNRNILASLWRQPLTWLKAWLPSLGLALICTGLGFQSIGQADLFWVVPTALVWATCVLIYGRLLGRLGWVLTRGSRVRSRRKGLGT